MRLFLTLIILFCPTLASADVGAESADAAYDAGDYLRAGQLYEQSVAEEFSPSARLNALYNAACSYSLAGNVESGLRCLDEAASIGLRQFEHVQRDTDLDNLRTDAAWPELFARIEGNATRLRDPAQALIVTEDLHRFWTAHAKLKEHPDQAAQILWDDYFEPGSNGLKDYYASRIESVDAFLANYHSMPAYYDAIREQTLRTEQSRKKFAEAFAELKRIYADAIFPDIVFVIGRFSSMGTVSASGLLIGADMLAAGEGIPLDEMSEWKRRVVRDMDGLVPIVAHELIHAQQSVSGRGLLASTIKEGGADFVARRICGRLTNPAKYDWADAREGEIWERFVADLERGDPSDWVANAASDSAEWPSEMGYYVGYQICEAYYEQAEDKDQAIRDMLVCPDPKAFLDRSGYTTRWVAND